MLDSLSPTPGQRQRIFRRLIGEALLPHWPAMLLALVAMAVVAGMTAASAALMNPVVNKVFVEHDKTVLWLVGAAVAATFLVKSLAAYLQDTLLSHVGQRVIADLQARLFRHLLDQDVGLFDAERTGALVSHFTYDITVMRQAVSTSLVGIGRDGLSVVCLIGVMVWQDPLLSLVTLVVAPLTVLPVQMLARRLKRASGRIQAEMGGFNAALSETFQGIRIVKSFNREATEAARIDALTRTLYRLNFRSARIQAAVQPIIDAFGGLAVAGVIIYGGLRVVDGDTTAGAFFSFIAAVLMAYQPMRTLGKVMPSLQDGIAAGERVYALLDRQPALADRADAIPVSRVPGEVRFEEVAFSYGADNTALDGLSFVAAAGRVTALVGPSGAGKSTVFNLIPRFYEASAGRVLVNGADVRDVTVRSLRDAIAIVGQDVMLFDDTIAANIAYGRAGAMAAEIEAAARAAAADGFIRALPNGYATRVGERGLRLSGGQRQRIAIARALLKDAPILLLDEATSALDTESERLIQEALDRLMRGRTTLVIAHRLSTIRSADMIHVMQDGRVVESGVHEALIAAGGVYARLASLQFGGEETGFIPRAAGAP